MDASHFASARDNFSVVIGMGVLSKESVDIMFHDYKDIMEHNKSQGTGSIILGNQFKNIIVTQVRNISKLETSIVSTVVRYPVV